MTIKVLTIVGARPQFIKAATLSREIKKFDKINEIIVHTGQHYNYNMSKIFFKELKIPKPKYFLGINKLDHGAMTGKMLEKIEKVFKKENPNLVIVFGDTNSTLAGSLAARKLNIPVAHIEAGLRSNNQNMPEECNRILTDRISTILFCPSSNAIKNLKAEGFPFSLDKNTKQKLINIGDVMIDAMIYYKRYAKKNNILNKLKLKKKNYLICTLHRQENINDNLNNLLTIIDALEEISRDIEVILPIHPRTKKKIIKNKKLFNLGNIKIIDPQSYFAMQCLLINAKMIITDSGGVQKEAYFYQVPCITLRDETEWIETLKFGWNQLIEINKKKIISAIKNNQIPLKKKKITCYGRGNSANLICKFLIKFNNSLSN